MHDDTTTNPLSATGPERSTRTFCMSVFDRWRCGLEDGHGGLHTAVEVGATTSWNDAVAGRMLREL